MSKTNVQLLMTGNELMTGDIVDSNSAKIAHALSNIGLAITRKITVSDKLSILIDEIRDISKKADILIINGGLGPTIDDMTSQALATAASIPIKEHPDALAHLKVWCEKKGVPLSHTNYKQAVLPLGCMVVNNPIGSAVGFSIMLNDCQIFCTPGVPSELSVMLEQEIIPILAQSSTEQFYLVRRFLVFGIGESKLQEILNNAYPEWPTEIELGFRANSPMLELKFTIIKESNRSILTFWIDKVHQLIGLHIIAEISEQPPTMAEVVVNLLAQQGKTLVTVESCTGGLIASQLTKISGASKVFEAGFVTYSNEMKTQMVSVNPDTLEKYGAVSKEVAKEMALGGLKKTKTDFVIAVTGIAGPTGGTSEKPVGSVWIAWGSNQKIQARYFCIRGNRSYFQKMTTTRSLDLIRRELLDSSEQAMYLKT